MSPPNTITKTPDMEAFERTFVAKCTAQFRAMRDNEKAACIAVINSRNANIAANAIVRTTEDQKKQLDALAARVQADRKAADARALVNQWLDKWQTNAAVIHMAVTVASAEYDLILKTRATKPIMAEIIFNIALNLLPELKVLERGFKFFTKHASVTGQIAYAATISKVTAASQLLDRQSASIISAIKSGKAARKDVDDASQELLTAHAAKNEAFNKVLGNIVSQLIQVSNLADVMYSVIDSGVQKDPVAVVDQVMRANGLPPDDQPIDPNLYGLLSRQILYDMLRIYASKYTKATRNSFSGPDGSYSFEGLDEAQRDMIYARYGWFNWMWRPNYPTLFGDYSLVTDWKVPVTQLVIPRAG